MTWPCHACEGTSIETPRAIRNRPGRSALDYRIGTHATFLETLKARLSLHRFPAADLQHAVRGLLEQPPLLVPLLNSTAPPLDRDRPLSQLTTRDPDDPLIALLDGWATVADILTFYQERIANEGYLRTATQRRSILELSRLVGYEPRPGVASSVYLAFTLDEPPKLPPGLAGFPALPTTPGTSLSTPAEIVIPKGTKAKSTPAPGSREEPQTFETTRDLLARPEWNVLRPRKTRPHDISINSLIDLEALTFVGANLRLRRGDWLAVRFGDDKTATPLLIAKVAPDNERQLTQVTLRPHPLSAKRLLQDVEAEVSLFLASLANEHADMLSAALAQGIRTALLVLLNTARKNLGRTHDQWRLQSLDGHFDAAVCGGVPLSDGTDTQTHITRLATWAAANRDAFANKTGGVLYLNEPLDYYKDLVARQAAHFQAHLRLLLSYANKDSSDLPALMSKVKRDLWDDAVTVAHRQPRSAPVFVIGAVPQQQPPTGDLHPAVVVESCPSTGLLPTSVWVVAKFVGGPNVASDLVYDRTSVLDPVGKQVTLAAGSEAAELQQFLNGLTLVLSDDEGLRWLRITVHRVANGAAGEAISGALLELARPSTAMPPAVPLRLKRFDATSVVQDETWKATGGFRLGADTPQVDPNTAVGTTWHCRISVVVGKGKVEFGGDRRYASAAKGTEIVLMPSPGQSPSLTDLNSALKQIAVVPDFNVEHIGLLFEVFAEVPGNEVAVCSAYRDLVRHDPFVIAPAAGPQYVFANPSGSREQLSNLQEQLESERPDVATWQNRLGLSGPSSVLEEVITEFANLEGSGEFSEAPELSRAAEIVEDVRKAVQEVKNPMPPALDLLVNELDSDLLALDKELWKRSNNSQWPAKPVVVGLFESLTVAEVANSGTHQAAFKSLVGQTKTELSALTVGIHLPLSKAAENVEFARDRLAAEAASIDGKAQSLQSAMTRWLAQTEGYLIIRRQELLNQLERIGVGLQTGDGWSQSHRDTMRAFFAAAREATSVPCSNVAILAQLVKTVTESDAFKTVSDQMQKAWTAVGKVRHPIWWLLASLLSSGTAQKTRVTELLSEPLLPDPERHGIDLIAHTIETASDRVLFGAIESKVSGPVRAEWHRFLEGVKNRAAVSDTSNTPDKLVQLVEVLRKARNAGAVSQRDVQTALDAIAQLSGMESAMLTEVAASLAPPDRQFIFGLLRAYRVDLPDVRARVCAFRTPARLFGWNAPQSDLGDLSSQQLFDALKQGVACLGGVNGTSADPAAVNAATTNIQSVLPPQRPRALHVESDDESESDDILFLDGAFVETAADSLVAIQRRDGLDPLCLVVEKSQTRPRSQYGLKGETTRVDLYAGWWRPDAPGTSDTFDVLKSTRVYCDSEELELDQVDLGSDFDFKSVLELDGIALGLSSGKPVVVDGEPVVSAVGLDQRVALHSQVSSAYLKIDATIHGDRWVTVVTLDRAPDLTYRRDTVKIYANVVEATHGETVREILGGGDGAQEFQGFDLKRALVTHVPAPTPQGVRRELAVKVNDVEWTAVPNEEMKSLFKADGDDGVYVSRTNNQHQTRVLFGDGEHGARLPTGRDNVRAVYRFGLGEAGNVGAQQIDQLLGAPLGVSKVINPLPAEGGADPDSPEQARTRAPLAVTSMDRLVSTQDFADFAMSFGGIGQATATRLGGIVHLTVAGTTPNPLPREGLLLRNLREALRRFGDPQQRFDVHPHSPKLLVIVAKVAIAEGREWEIVERDVRRAVQAQFDFRRAAFDQDALLADLIATVQDVPGVEYVDVDMFGAVSSETTPGLTSQLREIGRKARIEPDPVRLATPEESNADVTTGPPGDASAAANGNTETATASQPAASPFRGAELIYLTPDVPDTLILERIP